MERQEKPFKNNPRYTYIEELRAGISGVVLLGGRDTLTGTKVVIKHPDRTMAKDKRERHAESIAREIRALKALQDVAGICHLLDHQITRNSWGIATNAYIVIEFSTGRSLVEWGEEYRQMDTVPWLEILTVFTELTELLEYAHAHGLVHNDVDIKHIFWDRDHREFRLLDWGNVIFYQEEKKGEQITPMTDIKQVGEALYQLLENLIPFGDPRTLEFDAVRWPDYLRRVVVKMLTKDGYDSMAMLHQEFEELHQQEINRIRVQADAMPLSELQTILTIVNNTQPDLVNEIQYHIHQRQWQITKTYLAQGPEYPSDVYTRLELLERENAEIGIDIHQIVGLCHAADADYGGKWPELPEAINHLVVGDLDALIEIYARRLQNSHIEVLRAAHALARRQNIPVVRLDIDWMNRELEIYGESLRMDAPKSATAVRRIQLDLWEATENFQSTKSPICETECQAYQYASTILAQLSDRLKLLEEDAQIHNLMREALRIAQSAERIVKLLESFLADEFDIVLLYEAKQSDQSNPILTVLLQTVQFNKKALARLDELNGGTTPTNWDDFEALLGTYQELFQSTASLGEDYCEKWSIVEQLYENIAVGNSDDVNSAKPFPPLYRFLENQVSKLAKREQDYVK